MPISAKTGGSGRNLNEWGNKAEVDNAKRTSVSGEMAGRMKVLERENRELRQANEIFRKASAYFAMARLAVCRQIAAGQRELDRRSK